MDPTNAHYETADDRVAFAFEFRPIERSEIDWESVETVDDLPPDHIDWQARAAISLFRPLIAGGRYSQLMALDDYFSNHIKRAEKALQIVPLEFEAFRRRANESKNAAHVKRNVLRAMMAEALVVSSQLDWSKEPEVLAEMRRQVELSGNERDVAMVLVRNLRRQVKGNSLTREQMRTVIDRTRKRNNKGNFAAAGRELGVTGDTAKRWIRERGLLEYALQANEPRSPSD